MGRKVDAIMKNMVKVFCMLMIAIVVFLGGLLISEGIDRHAADSLFEYQEGSAL